MIIYSKHSNERKKEFAIRTDIIKDGSILKIRKSALYDDGKGHIDDLIKKSIELDKLYSKVNFLCNMPIKINEKTLEFDFVKGKNLDEEIDALIDKGDIDKARETLYTYINKIKVLFSQIKFTKTEKFTKIFGDVEVEDGLTSGIISNIDILCQNAIISNGYTTIIDNEWTFDFPIPTQFIIYRIIHYFVLTKEKRVKIGLNDLYEKYGITSDRLGIYESMECNFQSYIKGNIKTLGELHGDITPGQKNFDTIGKDILEVSFYNDNHLLNKTLTECNNGSIEMPFTIDNKCNKIILKCKNLIYNIVALSINDENNNYELENIKERPGMCLWNTKDNLIVNLKNEISGNNVFKAHFVKLTDQVESILINDSRIISSMELENSRLKQELAMLQDKVTQMENTKVWKFYSKYKKINN